MLLLGRTLKYKYRYFYGRRKLSCYTVRHCFRWYSDGDNITQPNSALGHHSSTLLDYHPPYNHQHHYLNVSGNGTTDSDIVRLSEIYIHITTHSLLVPVVITHQSSRIDRHCQTQSRGAGVHRAASSRNRFALDGPLLTEVVRYCSVILINSYTERSIAIDGRLVNISALPH